MIFELFEVEVDWSIQPKPKRNDVRRTSDVLNYSLVMRDMNNTKPPSYSSAHDTFLLHKLVPIGRFGLWIILCTFSLLMGDSFEFLP